MAGESTYSDISSLVNTVWEGALLKAREMRVCEGLVTVFNDRSDMALRKNESYTGGTVLQSLAEISDMSSQTFTPAVLSTLTPAQVGAQYYLTDLRIVTDPNQVQRDAASDLGNMIAEKVDKDLVGLFDDLTGGTVGTAGGTVTWANVFNAITKLRVQLAPAPYIAVVRPEQWYYLANTLAVGQTVTNAPAAQNQIAASWFAGQMYGVDFYIDANITAGTAAVGALFSREAMALDVRRAFRLEPQRDASRGGGGWELNATAVYAAGVWRPLFGCQMIGTSTVA